MQFVYYLHAIRIIKIAANRLGFDPYFLLIEVNWRSNLRNVFWFLTLEMCLDIKKGKMRLPSQSLFNFNPPQFFSAQLFHLSSSIFYFTLFNGLSQTTVVLLFCSQDGSDIFWYSVSDTCWVECFCRNRCGDFIIFSLYFVSFHVLMTCGSPITTKMNL